MVLRTSHGCRCLHVSIHIRTYICAVRYVLSALCCGRCDVVMVHVYARTIAITHASTMTILYACAMAISHACTVGGHSTIAILCTCTLAKVVHACTMAGREALKRGRGHLAPQNHRLFYPLSSKHPSLEAILRINAFLFIFCL